MVKLMQKYVVFGSTCKSWLDGSMLPANQWCVIAKVGEDLIAVAHPTNGVKVTALQQQFNCVRVPVIGKEEDEGYTVVPSSIATLQRMLVAMPEVRGRMVTRIPEAWVTEQLEGKRAAVIEGKTALTAEEFDKAVKQLSPLNVEDFAEALEDFDPSELRMAFGEFKPEDKPKAADMDVKVRFLEDGDADF